MQKKKVLKIYQLKRSYINCSKIVSTQQGPHFYFSPVSLHMISGPKKVQMWRVSGPSFTTKGTKF